MAYDERLAEAEERVRSLTVQVELAFYEGTRLGGDMTPEERGKAWRDSDARKQLYSDPEATP